MIPTKFQVISDTPKAAVFAIGAFKGPQHTPYAFVFKKLVKPRLTSEPIKEDCRPPQFAQRVGLGFTVVAIIGTGAKSVLFGHMPSYKVRVAGGLQVATSTDYAFNTDVTTFRVMMRVDGDLTHASHIKYFKGAAS